MDKKQADLFNKRVDQLSNGAKFALVLCANAFRFGGNWAVIRNTNKDYKSTLEELKQEKPHVKVIQASNGAIILCEEMFLTESVNLVLPGAISTPFFEMAKQREEEENAKFTRFVGNVLAGKNSHVVKKDGYYEIIIGVFCVNDVNYIRIAGDDYPAYKLSLLEALDFIMDGNKDGHKIYVRAMTAEGVVVFDLVEKLGYNSKGVAAMYRGLEIADSDTGAFLTLRIVPAS